jgi:hypothetical protein
VADIIDIFNQFKYEPPLNLGEWGASCLYVMGRKEANYDPDIVNRHGDLN